MINTTRKERIEAQKMAAKKNTACKNMLQTPKKVAITTVLGTGILVSANTGIVEANGFSHTVKAGDTVYSLAKDTGTNVDTILEVNGMTSPTIYVGQDIDLPEKPDGEVTTHHKHEQHEVTADSNVDPSSTNHTVSSGETLYSISIKYKTTVEALKSKNQLTGNTIFPGEVLELPSGSNLEENIQEPVLGEAVTTNSQDIGIYTVKPGDTLWSLADTFNTVTGELKSLNNKESNLVIIGDQLQVNLDLLLMDAAIINAVDPTTLEITMNDGEVLRLQVPYGTSVNY